MSAAPELTLYGYWRSSSTWRVRIALEWKGLEWKNAPVHLLRDGGEHHTDAHRARNPAAQVPVLKCGDRHLTQSHLTQSVAICEWLEETHPTPPLLPADPWQRAQTRALVEHINSGTQPLQNLRVLQEIGGAQGADARLAWGRRWIERGLAAYDALVAETAGRHSVGDAVTLADLFLIPQLYNARRFSADLAPFPRLLALEAACAQLPAFQRAHPDAMPDAE